MLLQYMHRNDCLVLVGSSRGFRIKRNIGRFFGIVHSFSGWLTFFAVLRVTGAIFGGGKAQAGTLAYPEEISSQI